MVNDQIIEYAKTQLKRGVTPDALRSSLLQVGWPAGDVDDSLRRATEIAVQEKQTPQRPSVVVQPSQSGSFSSAGSPSTASSNGFSSRPSTSAAPKTPLSEGGPSLNVRDVFGNSNSRDSYAPAAGSPGPVSQTQKINPSSSSVSRPTASGVQQQPARGGSKGLLIALASVALIALSATIFFFTKSQNASGESAGLSAQVTTLTAKVSDLSSQLATLQKSKDDADQKLASSTFEMSGIVSELLFFTTPATASGTAKTQQAPFALKGLLSFDGTRYALATSHGIKAFVKNSKDAKIVAVLAPLLGKTVELSGTHAPVSRDVTVSAVNGKLIQ